MLENKSNTEEDRVAIVEQQLAQAKLIAEEADKKYEEVKYRHRRLLHSVQTFDFYSKSKFKDFAFAFARWTVDFVVISC